MRTKTVVNPCFQKLSDDILNIIDECQSRGQLIYSGRNQLWRISCRNVDLAVKCYKVPNLLSAIDYSLLRASKARRAYEYALRLLELGVDTPAPVAYVEQYSGRLFRKGYFISVFADNMSDVRNLEKMPQQQLDGFIPALAEFTASLHSKGIFHIDYSPGNILYKGAGQHYEFMLVDINRMRFDVFSVNHQLRNFERLIEDATIWNMFVACYAQKRNLDKRLFISKADSVRNVYLRKCRIKKIFKSLLCRFFS